MSRTFSGPELAARAWYYLSPFPAERGIAARKYRELARVVPDDDERLQILGELAADGYHAIALTPRVAQAKAAALVFRQEGARQAANAAHVRSIIHSLAAGLRLSRSA